MGRTLRRQMFFSIFSDKPSSIPRFEFFRVALPVYLGVIGGATSASTMLVALANVPIFTG